MQRVRNMSVSLSERVSRIGTEINLQGYEHVEVVPGSVCIGCGMCVLACPEPRALTIVKHTEEEKSCTSA